jgi:hypothetical protein
MDKKIKEFVPLCQESRKLKSELAKMGIEQLIAFEVDHCP